MRAVALIAAIVVVIVGVSSCANLSLPEGVAAVEQIRISPNDDRDYRFIQLDNALKVLLISDLEADKSAASLSVFRGNYSDPEGYPGLAHFLEHMLFIGTDKYPETDGYFKFIQAHGGRANAYTATDLTNYFFDIRPEYFPEALDRFAHFFISPTLDPDYVARERNAVDSEYRLRIRDDNWRGFMASKAAVNPEHPFGQFNIGTLDSFDDTARDALVTLFESEYSANQMALVVVGPEPIDHLQALVVPIFNQIPNRNLPDFNVTVPLFTADQLPAVLTHQSLKDNYSVSFSFPVPNLDRHYRVKPGAYIANLLGHEAEGSIHRALIQQGWITGMGAWAQSIDQDTSTISINISLTPEGREHIPQITDAVFDYIEMLRNSPPAQWLYDEQSRVAELSFRFQDKQPASRMARILSPAFAKFPVADVITQNYLMERFDADLIKRYLDLLTPGNALMEIVGPDVETDQVTEYFDVGYRLRRGPIPRQQVEDMNLHLPAPNPFIPENLSLVDADSSELPRITRRDDGLTIWSDQDTSFGVPRAVFNISLRNDGGLIELEDRVLGSLYLRMVQDALNTLSYPALLAGVGYDLATPPKGFRITTSGYNDKQLVLLQQILDIMPSLELDPARFNVLKADMLRSLRNQKSELPLRQTRNAKVDLLLSSSWPPEEQAALLESVGLDQLSTWRDKVFDRTDVEAMVVGNVEADAIDALAMLLERQLNIAEVNVAKPVVRDVDGPWLHEVEIDHNDASIVLHLQDPDELFTSRARSSLAAQLMRSAFFASLRTEQQLGYSVTVFSAPVYQRGGVTFLIQSPVAAPDVLVARTTEFLRQQIGEITNMPATTFEQYKAGLISQLMETDKNIQERSRRYWQDLDRGNTTFDSHMQLAAEIDVLSQPDMVDFFEDLYDRINTQQLLVFSRGRFDGIPTNESGGSGR